MQTCGTVFSAVSGKGYNPTHVMGSCAKIAAKMDEQQMIPLAVYYPVVHTALRRMGAEPPTPNLWYKPWPCAAVLSSGQ